MTSEDDGADKSLQSLPFEPGEYVHLIADPGVVGVVVRTSRTAAEARVHVFHDGREHGYFASQLSAHSVGSASTATAQEMRAVLAAHLATRPASSRLYSFDSGRIEYEPYQFRPVLKLISADRPRLLIADDVGVGKTIEAGLIIKELQARQRVESILVICPKPLVVEGKWRAEMKRFDEDFVELDSSTLRHCIEELRLEGRWPARYRKAILPFSLLDERFLFGDAQGRRKTRGIVGLEPPVKFDLVIVDEAHHARNPATWRHRAVEHLLSNAGAAVLISATPVQTGSVDLFNLLKLLRPDQFSGLDEFQRMREPNAAISRAEVAARSGGERWKERVQSHLAEALATTWGRVIRAEPAFMELEPILNGPGSSDEVRVRVTRLIQSLNTFSRLINRTRRRDIGAFTVRRPEAPTIRFTPEQSKLYDDVMHLAARIVASRGHGLSVEFLLSTFRRQASSSLNGLAPFLSDMLAGRLGEEELSEADVEVTDFTGDLVSISSFRREIEEIADRASQLDGDPKLDALLTIVSEKQLLENNKLLVFSSFRHTLRYLEQALSGRGVRVGLVHGGLDDNQRRDVRARFALDRGRQETFDVLLSSEVGTEGLDNQFCDALVNYDLPWNPMRIEQRIGRIDRRGQRSESISIKNLVVSGTIDEIVYTRCLDRIGIFQESLGAGEEILGELADGIRSIALDFRLSEELRASKLQQLADNSLARIQEQASLEEKESALFGLEVQKEADDGVARARSPWLSAELLSPLVAGYLAGIGVTSVAALVATGTMSIRPSAKARSRMLADARDLGLGEGSFVPWLSWLTADTKQSRTLTFDPVIARTPDSELLSVTHPLVRLAAEMHSADREVNVSLRADSMPGLPVGRYPFAVVGWEYFGIKADYQVRVVTTPSLDEAVVLDALLRATDGDEETLQKDKIELASWQFGRWESMRATHMKTTRALADARRVSLEVSHAAMVAQREQQLAAMDDPKIKVMRRSQLETAESEHLENLVNLETAALRCDIRESVLAVGILEVE